MTMIIVVKDVLSGPRTYAGEESPSILEIKSEEADLLKVTRPIHYRLRAYAAGDQLIVEGEVKAEVEFHCVRCAEVFFREVADSAFQRFIPLPDKTASVDLTADIRETILLHFPPYPACQPGCKGLCGLCGKNLNRGQCRCRPAADFRWSELEKLQMPGKEKPRRAR
jgi:uncharacterized protein